MKQLFTLILCLTSLHFAIAETVKVKIGELYYNLDTDAMTAEVTYDTDSTPRSSSPAYASFSNKDLSIPETVKNEGADYSVISIGAYAFYYCSGLKSVAFSNNVTTIGSSAFYYCTGLSQITLPQSLTSIRSSAFYRCTGLKSVIFSDGFMTIERYAFEDCSELQEVKTPSLEAWLNIKFESLDSNPNQFAKNLLINGEELSGTVTIPNEWTEIPTAQFAGCDAVTDFIFPENLSNIGEGAFYGCSALTSVSLSDNITIINDMAFECCSNMRDLKLPKNLISIGKSTFAMCSSLSSIDFPNGLQSIKDKAFQYTSLSSVSFPESLKELEVNSFSGCVNLLDVSFSEGITYISSGIFTDCINLVSVTLPKSLTLMDEAVFYNCISLQSINLPDNLSGIASMTFNGCTSLKTITLPKNLTFIEPYAFQNCKSLTSIALPQNIEAIGPFIFENCSNLRSVSLHDNLKSIDEKAFANCISLNSIIFPESITSIGTSAFQGCINLKSIILPKNVNSIGNYAFDGCASLKKIVSLNDKSPSILQDTFSSSAKSYGLYVPEGSVDTYKNATYWKNFWVINPLITTVGLELSADRNYLEIGDTLQIIATLNPDNASVAQFEWQSSDESVASIDINGKVTALKPGITTITAKTTDGSNIDANITLNVVESVGKFEINDFNIRKGAILEVPLNLDLLAENIHYCALQFDLTLPDGIEIEDISLGQELQAANLKLRYIAQESGVIRVIVTPTNNLNGVNTTEKLLTLTLKATDKSANGLNNIIIADASLSDVGGNDIFLEDSSCELFVILLGDANDNGMVTVADVVTIANYIVHNYVANWSFVNADINGSDDITAADITGTINIIAGEDVKAATLASRKASLNSSDRLCSDDFTPTEGESFNIGVRLENANPYSAIQAAVIIPEGMTVETVTTGNQAPNHSMIYNLSDENRIDVVIFSLNNEPFANNDGTLFDLRVNASADCGDLDIRDIIASDATARDYNLSFEGGRNAGNPTGIDNIGKDMPKVAVDGSSLLVFNAEGGDICIYSVTGRMIDRRKATEKTEIFSLDSGVYMIKIANQTFKIIL